MVYYSGIPDVVGFTLGEARGVLDNSGVSITAVRITAPPKEITAEYDDSFRVLRLNIIGDKSIELLICKPL